MTDSHHLIASITVRPFQMLVQKPGKTFGTLL